MDLNFSIVIITLSSNGFTAGEKKFCFSLPAKSVDRSPYFKVADALTLRETNLVILDVATRTERKLN